MVRAPSYRPDIEAISMAGYYVEVAIGIKVRRLAYFTHMPVLFSQLDKC
jgi:hypothetical protein